LGPGRFWAGRAEGWASLRQNRFLLLLAVWAFLGTLGGGAIGALWPVVVFRTFHGEPATLGIVEAAPVVGSVAGGLVTGWVARRFSVGQVLVAAGTLMGLGEAGFAPSHSLWFGLPLFTVTGLGQTALNSSFNAFFQATVPSEVMGRTFGILGAIENAAGPLSAAAAGVLGGFWGPGPVMAAGGVWMTVSGLLLVANRPAMAARLTGMEVAAE
jgi:MFS family permease